VIDALERILQVLKFFKQTPENGLAVFAGNISQMKQDIRVFYIIPPEPIKISLYRCNHKFHLEPLKELLESKDIYGLIVIDRQEANIGILKGKRIELLKTLESAVPGKFKAGGQSARRFERVIEGLARDFYKKVGEVASKCLLQHDIKGLLIGGPGPTKNEFASGDYLDYRLKEKLIGVVDTGYADEYGLEELVNKAKDLIKESEIAKEKRIMNKFLTMLAKEDELVTYGRNEVIKSLKQGCVDVLLVSESLDAKFIQELKKTADEMGTKVEIISTETREGKQLEALGGLGAILRFRVS